MDDSGALLVVDDEQFLREAVAILLSSLGFTVASAGTGTEALRLARSHRFDLLILDVMLPDLDGFEIVQRLRRDRNHVPVIFLTAKDTREDKVAGLTMGGDDYITKPFHLDELTARVRTVLRRTRPVPDDPVLTFADITLDQDKYEVRRGGHLIELSPTEFRLLRYSCSTRAGCSPTPSSWPTCGTTSSSGRTRSWPRMSSTCGAS